MRTLIAAALVVTPWFQPLQTGGGGTAAGALRSAAQPHGRYLYVGVPGSDDSADAGVPGVLVFDIDADHRLVRRIPVRADDRPRGGSGELVRGIAADVERRRLYVSTSAGLAALDLATDRVVWERTYDGGCCDRLDVSPDGAVIYAPALGSPKWHVVHAADGRLLATIDVQGFPRQTLFSRDGRRAFLAAWESPVISVVDAKAHRVVRHAGPFGGSVCPFTVNGGGTLAFANVDGLVGFEVADLQTGAVLDRVILDDSDAEAWPRYECPSHGIAMTPDGRQLWVADGVDNRLHVFDATVYPPAPSRTIALQAQPRWITFGADGRYAYVSSGDVIEAASGTLVATLADGRRTAVRSGAMIEIDFERGAAVRATRQTSTGGM